ncbi:MAG: Gfo/Idh/MocA family oxidoreductase [Chloroflexi bacterium]|nr:Gfo/Idh/MocA family oxidoreductase [Chloroflexota bacterium]
MKVGLIGCGLVGQKRAAALGEHELVACVDTLPARSAALAERYPGCLGASDARAVIDNASVQVVIVATVHDALASTARQAAERGKHVLIEKPGARTSAELEQTRAAVERAGVAAKVGFNHRFHPALRQARRIVDEGGVGKLMYVRGRYGHGGRPNYEHEWRADPRRAGGGELLDQGSHLIDLARWFGGEVAQVDGHVGTYFWPMPVEDNAFISLRTTGGQAAWLHASWSEWKNLFSFEIFGRTGKLQVDGLGGSYGTETLTYYRMLPEMGPPETTTWHFPGPDSSWRDEFAHFVDCIEHGGSPSGSLADGLANLRVVEALYRRSGRDYHA